MTAKAKKVSKLRMGAGVAVAAVGLSLAGSLAPAVASAAPLVPFSGPFHPVRHTRPTPCIQSGRSGTPCAPLSPDPAHCRAGARVVPVRAGGTAGFVVRRR